MATQCAARCGGLHTSLGQCRRRHCGFASLPARTSEYRPSETRHPCTGGKTDGAKHRRVRRNGRSSTAEWSNTRCRDNASISSILSVCQGTD